jgi:predicted nuclease with TOPRIM domain
MVSNYNEQLKIKEINNGLFRNENNELKDKISFINNDFAKLTESNQKLQKKIKVLYQQLEQVSNAFLMKNEELNTYIYQYSVYNGKNIMTATGFDYGHQEAGNNDFLTVQS